MTVSGWCIGCDELGCVGGAGEAFFDGVIDFVGKQDVDFSFLIELREKKRRMSALEAYRWHQMTRIEPDDGSFLFFISSFNYCLSLSTPATLYDQTTLFPCRYSLRPFL